MTVLLIVVAVAFSSFLRVSNALNSSSSVYFAGDDDGIELAVIDGDVSVSSSSTRIFQQPSPAAASSGISSSTRLHYDGFKVVRAVPFTPVQLSALLKMTYEVEFDFWSQPRMLFTPVDVVVEPQAFPKLREMLREHWIVHWVTSNDLERNFFSADFASFGTRLGERFSFNEFHRLDDIYKRLDEYRSSYPTEVTVTVIGKTHEGREIKMVRLTDGKASVTPKKVIFLDGGTHAREWITVSTVMYILDQLMSLTADTAIRAKFDWHIVPVVNPDGYEYTQVTDRFWRKNRAPLSLSNFGRTATVMSQDELPAPTFQRFNGPSENDTSQDRILEGPISSSMSNGTLTGSQEGTSSSSWFQRWMPPNRFSWTQLLWNWISGWSSAAGNVQSNNKSTTRTSEAAVATDTTRSTQFSTATPRTCVGVDLNRNWGHYWGKIGVDFNPCSFTFPGTGAFSELETQAMRDAFEAVHDRTLLYISYHSYGEMILLPWGYTYLVPDNFSDMKEKARLYAGKMRSWYKVGSGTWILYPAAGVTMDWVTHKGVPYVFTIELSPSRFQPVPGFAIPASEINRVGSENWDGLKALAIELARTTT